MVKSLSFLSFNVDSFYKTKFKVYIITGTNKKHGQNSGNSGVFILNLIQIQKNGVKIRLIKTSGSIKQMPQIAFIEVIWNWFVTPIKSGWKKE